MSSSSNGVVGTFHWMAPEVMRGDQKVYTQAADIYSMGMILYEVLTDTVPFHQVQMPQLLFLVTDGERPEILNASDINTSPSKQALQQIMTQCWQQEPAKRPDSKTVSAQVRQLANAEQNEHQVPGLADDLENMAFKFQASSISGSTHKPPPLPPRRTDRRTDWSQSTADLSSISSTSTSRSFASDADRTSHNLLHQLHSAQAAKNGNTVLHVLSQAPAAAEVQCEGLRLLSTEIDLCGIQQQTDICKLTVAALSAFAQHRDIQMYGLDVLVRLTDTDLKRARARSCSAGEPVTSELYEYLAIEANCTSFSNLGQAGACQMVANILESSTQDPTVQFKAVVAVGRLAYITTNRSQLGTEAVCRTLLGILQTSLQATRPRIDFIEQSLFSIYHLARENEDNRTELNSAGVSEAVVQAICACRQHADTQVWSILTVVWLADDEAARSVFGEHGACHAVIQSMRAFPKNHNIQHFGADAVYQLANDHDHNCARLDEAGVCQLILAILKSRDFRGRPKTLDKCLAVVAELAGNDSRRSKLGKEACKVVVQTMKDFPRNTGLLDRGVRAILQLAANHVGNSTQLISAGARDVVGDAMLMSPPDCPGKQYTRTNGAAAITVLALSNDTNCKRLSEGSSTVMYSALVQSMRSCKQKVQSEGADEDDNQLQTQNMLAINNLSARSDTHQSKLSAAGAWQEMMQAMNDFPTLEQLQQIAMLTVSNVCGSNPSMRAVLGNYGACEAVIQTLSRFPNSTELQEGGIKAVCNLACDNAGNARKLASLGALSLVQQGMCTHTGNFNIQQTGNTALQNIQSLVATAYNPYSPFVLPPAVHIPQFHGTKFY